MINRFIIILLLATIASCSPSTEEDRVTNEQAEETNQVAVEEKINSPSKENDPSESKKLRKEYQLKELGDQFEEFILLDLSTPINEDLNGDGIAEKAVFYFRK